MFLLSSLVQCSTRLFLDPFSLMPCFSKSLQDSGRTSFFSFSPLLLTIILLHLEPYQVKVFWCPPLTSYTAGIKCRPSSEASLLDKVTVNFFFSSIFTLFSYMFDFNDQFFFFFVWFEICGSNFLAVKHLNIFLCTLEI